ncbi:MAG: hypothetical protein OXN89_18465, partial [Bryobacterales bacterium]|nr:hypothetical protein [Bryobacterales bacterium]
MEIGLTEAPFATVAQGCESARKWFPDKNGDVRLIQVVAMADPGTAGDPESRNRWRRASGTGTTERLPASVTAFVSVRSWVYERGLVLVTGR